MGWVTELYWQDPVAARATIQASYRRNRPAHQAYHRAYHQTHATRKRAATQCWRLEHPGYSQEYDRSHPEQKAARDARRRARKLNAPINDLTAQDWLDIQAAYEYRCAYCHTRCKGKLTQDHIQPLARGGSNTKQNVVPACRPCNSKKHTGPVPSPVQPLLL